MRWVLVIGGGILQVGGYVLTALQLRRTRRRVMNDVVMLPIGHHAFDSAPTSDVATSRPPTTEERLDAIERSVGSLVNDRLELEAAMGRRAEADRAEQALGRGREFLDRARFERVSIGLFIAGVALSVSGALI